MLGRILFLFLLLFSQILYSSSNDFYFKRISVEDGLSNSWVRCIYQDDIGYIWIGTSDGLNRYDGINFKVYTPTNSINQVIGNITINSIVKKDAKNLMIGTDIGLFNYNYDNDTFKPDSLFLDAAILSIVKEANSTYWIGTNKGLVRLDSANNIKKYYSLPENQTSLCDNYINKLFVDSKNRLWIGTIFGLNIYNREKDNFLSYSHIPNDKKSISGNDILSIVEDKTNQIWIGTALNGLNLVIETDTNYSFNKIIEGTIISITPTKNNQLWIGYGSEGGLKKIYFDPKLKKITENKIYKKDPLDNKTISDNSIFSLYIDTCGDLWIGTFGGGLNYYSERAKKFHIVEEKYGENTSIRNNLVNAFLEEDEYFWIGTEGGLDRINKSTGLFEHFQYESNNSKSLSSNPVFIIFKDSKGYLWVGNWAGGLNRFDYKTKTFKRFINDHKKGSISNSNVFSIAEDQYGNLWIGTEGGGLNRFNYENETFINYKHDENDLNSIAQNQINDILITSDGKLFFSLYKGIDEYDYENDNFKHLNLSANQNSNYKRGNIFSLFEDSKKAIWICTNTGLEHFDFLNNTFHTYTINEGLPNNTIQGVLEDDHENLWISTNYGISKFINGINSPENSIFQNFSSYDGLSSNNFKVRAVYKSHDGIMYFGSSNGYTFFHPDSIKINSLSPEIVLTDFLQLTTYPDQNSKYKSFTGNINVTKKLDLKYLNSDFIIHFAALNYLNPEKNQYKYKLDGYDNEWIDANNNMNATYTSIQPGKYTFKVMGSNNDGVWLKIPKEIDIEIHPPWWNTLLFKLTVLVLLFITVFILIGLRFSMLNKQNKELEEKVNKRTYELTKTNTLLKQEKEITTIQNSELSKHRNNLEQLVEERTTQLEKAKQKAEESDRLKSAFLANMSHEIRTPMNAILGFSSLLVEEDLSEMERKSYSEMINRNGETLGVLINDIIDISIIEANELVLNKTTFYVSPILNELFHYFKASNSKQLNLIFNKNNSAQQLQLNNDEVRFRQILVNLLNNAFKYTEKGNIEFGFETNNNQVLFYVSDTGIGIENADMDKIFDHFYKANHKKDKLYSGTGIGLSICKKLITKMGGKIWFTTELHMGTTFYFSLPYK